MQGCGNSELFVVFVFLFKGCKTSGDAGDEFEFQAGDGVIEGKMKSVEPDPS
jgi:hypothetical protein